MKKTSRWILGSAICILAVLLSFQASNAEWWWSVGPVYRGGMEVEFSGRSYVQELQIQGGRAYWDLAGIGLPNEIGDRAYDNGFVNMDPITSFDGLTWFWGYQSAAQYVTEVPGGALWFSKDGVRQQTRSVVSSTSINSSDDMDGWGLGAVVGRNLAEQGNVRIGVNVGATALWDMESKKTESTYSEQFGLFSYMVVDAYPTFGQAIPVAPYEGTFFGLGPTIPNIPLRREEMETGRTFWRAENTVALSVNVALQELWFGPRLEMDVANDVSAYLTPFASVNRVEARLERKEDFALVYPDGRREVLQSWNDRKTDEEWLLGVGARAGARANLKNDWFVDVGVAYEWVDEMKAKIGPNQAKIDLNSYNAHVHVGRPF